MGIDDDAGHRPVLDFTVILPDEPPALTPGAARALLRILMAHDKALHGDSTDEHQDAGYPQPAVAPPKDGPTVPE